MKIYLVGGAVRDELMGQPVHERDWVVVGATAETLLQQGFQQVGKDFPVFLHPQTKEEYALARTERKTQPGYHGFKLDSSPGVTLEEDLKRRDLTINAIAKSEDGTIVDPFGGQEDIKHRQLRHVSEAFAEDPVRILRIARFMAKFAHLGFQVADETMALMKDMVDSGEVDALVPERVWKEMERALSATTPGAFIETLRSCGALTKIFPELDCLWGIPQKPEWHPEIDTGVHTMMVLAQACQLSPKSTVRFAALCHDLGKGNTPKDVLPSHHGHEGRGVHLIQNFGRRYRLPNHFLSLAKAVAKHHLNCHRAFELKSTTLLKLLTHLNLFRTPDLVEDFLIACEADAKGRLGFEDRPYPQADFIRKAAKVAKACETKDLLDEGLEGKKFGEALSRRRAQAIQKLKDEWSTKE